MKKIRYTQIIIYSLLIIWAFFTLFPLAYMFYSSMMPPEEIKTGSIAVLQNIKKFTFENYKSLFESSSMFLWFINSVIICAVVTVLQLLLNGMAGYALAKKKFALRDHIF